MSRRASNNPAGKISRRAVLRGLGVTMALPWLESAAALAGAADEEAREAFWPGRSVEDRVSREGAGQ